MKFKIENYILKDLEFELDRLCENYKRPYQLSYVVYEEEYFDGTEDEYSLAKTSISNHVGNISIIKEQIHVMVMEHFDISDLGDPTVLNEVDDILQRVSADSNADEIADLLEKYVDYRTDVKESIKSYMTQLKSLVDAKKDLNKVTGRLVGIYKNNGEMEDGYNKNLLGFAYLSDSELDTSKEEIASGVSNLISLAQSGTGAGTSISKALMFGAESVVKLEKFVTNLSGYVIDNASSDLVQNTLLNISSERQILNDKINELEAYGELTSLTSDERANIDTMKSISGLALAFVCTFTPEVFVAKAAVSAVSTGIGILWDYYKDFVSSQDGTHELNRYYSIKNSEDEIIPFPDAPEYITATGEDDGTYAVLSKGFTRAVVDGTEKNYIQGNSDDNIIEAIDGKLNHFKGEAGNDMLIGYDNVDILEGGAGEDILVGGKGKDTLKGGIERDTYIYNQGDGKDTIVDVVGSVSSEGNKLVLKGIDKDDVDFNLNEASNDVVMTFGSNNSDEIVLDNADGFFESLTGKLVHRTNISEIEFDNTEGSTNLGDWVYVSASNPNNEV